MAKETMADKAKKKQKASKVSGLYEGVGKFKGKKSLNLRDKQLGKKGKAAAAKRTVSISKTEHMKEGPHKGKVVGPKGNPLTGKVDMGGGNMAVYRNGKRVTAKSSKSVKPKANSPKATPPKPTPPKPTPPKPTPPKPTPPKAKTSTLTAAQKAAARKGSGSSAGAKKGSDNSSGQSRVAAGRKTGTAKNPKTTKTGNGKSWYAQGGGGLTGPNSPIRGPKKLKEGSTKMFPSAGMGGKPVKMVVKNGKWTRA